MHTLARAHTHKYTHTHTHTHTHVHKHTHTHTHTHKHALTHTHSHALTHKHTHKHALTHTLTHKHALTHTHTHTHTLYLQLEEPDDGELALHVLPGLHLQVEMAEEVLDGDAGPIAPHSRPVLQVRDTLVLGCVPPFVHLIHHVQQSTVT